MEFQNNIKWTQLTSNVHSMTINCLFDPFQLKCIHISTNLVKKRDPYKIFCLRLKILWETGSQVPRHYPTLVDIDPRAPTIGELTLYTAYLSSALIAL